MEYRYCTKKLLTTTFLMAVASMGLAINGQAADKASATMEVTPQTSTVANIPATKPAEQANSYFYYYTVTDGDSISDTIPVQLCLTASSGTWTGFVVHFSDANGSLTGVSVPADTSFTPSNLTNCKTATITIATAPLILTDPAKPEERVANINVGVDDKDPNNLSISPSNLPDIHIHAAIKPAEAIKDTSCYMTDSSGNLLATCDGTSVTQSASTDGRFAITPNLKKGIEVSTNPGQFYYNILWTNKTGASQVVTVTFSGSNYVAKGAQAIHAYAFPPPFSSVTPEEFQAVNDAIPGGSGTSIKNITVPAGYTLWADYHMEWAGIGYPYPTTIATTCGTANQVLGFSATITGITDGVARTCAAGAKGYLK